MPNNLLNYTEYHIIEQVSQVRLTPGCTPSKFGCQEDRTTNGHATAQNDHRY